MSTVINSSALAEQLYLESDAMVRYALAEGQNVSAKVVEIIEKCTEAKEAGQLGACVESLTYAHNTLSEQLKPALPAAIYQLSYEEKKKSSLRFLGALPIMRKMVVVSLVFLLAMIGLSLSSEVSHKVLDNGVLDDSGLPLLINLLFLLTAAGVGAGFSILFNLRKEIKNATFQPHLQAGWWTRMVMGIVAGFILAEVIPSNVLDSVSAEESKLLLALAGGFSSNVVYKLMNLVVETMGVALQGGGKQITEIQGKKLRSEMEDKNRKQAMNLAAGLTQLNHEVASGIDKEALNSKIQDMLDTLVGDKGVPEVPKLNPLPSHTETVPQEKPAPSQPELHPDERQDLPKPDHPPTEKPT